MFQNLCTSAGEYMKNLPVDVRKRYEEKISVIQADPYQLLQGDFRNDFRKWPDLSYIDIVYFLVFQHSLLHTGTTKKREVTEFIRDAARLLGSRSFTYRD